MLDIIYKNENGRIIHGDNLEVLEKFKENSVDSCISDFPYNLSFMGKKWDNTNNFYNWCKQRAEKLHKIIKPGGYVCIFGHPKTNHRMKCAFEDVGFNIVEEIEWCYLTGMPKNQDIGKLFLKKIEKQLKEQGVEDIEWED
jgi:site-specific DNA-methyltransferase (adenine-specific)